MRHDARGRWTSEGRDLLLAALSTTTTRALARRVKVAPSALSNLSGGLRRWPSLPVALRLEQCARIAPAAWMRPSRRMLTKENTPRAMLDESKPPPRAA